MNLLKTCENLANWTYKNLTKNPGNMLLITGTLGWALSSLAQVTAVVINKKIPKEQKKFLLPQEIADAAVNISSFFTITSFFTNKGEALVKGGRLVTPKIAKFIKDNDLTSKIGTFEFGKTFTKFKKKEKMGVIPFSIEDTNAFKNNQQDIKEHYYKFSDAMGFAFGTAGAIVSANIVTPLLRNAIASEFQKYKSVQKPAVQEAEVTRPILAFNNAGNSRVSLEDFRTKTGPTYPNAISRPSYMSASSSSMKI